MNNKVGAYEYVPIEEVVAGAKMNLGIKDSSEDDAFLTDTVNRGVKRIKNRGSQVQAVATLQITSDWKAKLPEGFIKFVHPFPMIFVDAFGKTPIGAWYVPQFINNPFFEDSPFIQDQPIIQGGTVTISNGYLCFSPNTPTRFIKISFLTANIDINGDLAILALAEDALVSWSCWRYAMLYGGFSPQTINDWKQEWKSGRRELISFYNGNEGTDRPLIAYIMSVLI